MSRLVLIAIMLLCFQGSAHALSYTEAEHIGALCVSCHDKFSSKQDYAENLSAPVGSTDISEMYPCYKKPCHYSSPVKWGGGGNRYTRHMGMDICKNCHGVRGEFDIHKSHTVNGTTVNCNNCHAQVLGWNSSHVEVPPYEDIYIANSSLLNTSIRAPNWEGDCGYCHISIKNATRQHNIHENVIEEACIECHGKIIVSVPNPLKMDAVEEDDDMTRLEETLADLILKDYTLIFENISNKFLDFFNFMIS